MLNKNLIILFTGNHADIPAGFARETSLDGKFPKAWGLVAPNVTGGAATHIHSSPAHTHSFSAHGHSFQTTVNKHETFQSPGYGQTGVSGSNPGDLANGDHYHVGSTSGPIGVSVSTDAVTYSAVSNNPPFYEVIFIRATKNTLLPPDVLMLTDQAGLPSGFFDCDGENDTPDLRDKFLRGAATGQNAGTLGGSLTNSHQITHTHSTSHYHSGFSNPPIGGNNISNAGSDGYPYGNDNTHGHNINISSVNLTSTTNSTLADQAETVQPAYYKLKAIQNGSGIKKLPKKGMIALWLGATNAIPAGWKLCDGNNNTPNLKDKFVKIATLDEELGDTGGSHTHNHAAQSHDHSVPSHNHPGSVSPASAPHGHSGGGHNYWTDVVNPPHTLASVGNATEVMTSANTTANSSNNEPEYRTAAYVQFKFALNGGFLFGFV